MGRLQILGDVVDTLGGAGGRWAPKDFTHSQRICVHYTCKEPAARLTKSNIVFLRIVQDTGNVHYLLVIESSVKERCEGVL